MLRGILAVFRLSMSAVVVARGRPNSAVRLSADVVKANIIGNTEQWRHKGAAYYAPNGVIRALWKERDYEGTWWITDDGTMCIYIGNLGGESCWDYYKHNDKFHYYVEDDFVETSYKKGDWLKNFYE